MASTDATTLFSLSFSIALNSSDTVSNGLYAILAPFK